MVDEPGVGGVVRLLQVEAERLVHAGLQILPCLQGQLGRHPGLHDDACNHVRLEEVAGLKFVLLLEPRDARPQIIELAASAVQRRHGQAKGQPVSASFGVFGAGLDMPGQGLIRRVLTQPAERQPHPQLMDHALRPGRQVTRQQARTVVAPQTGPARCVHRPLRPGARQQVVADGGQRSFQLLRKNPARLPRRGLESAGLGHDKGRLASGCATSRYTTAPALGSFGSCSLPGPALTRSSRLTPSHMAMPAATKIEE